MSVEKTNTGWIQTVVTTHTITIAKKMLSSVAGWNKFNLKHPEMAKGRLTCDRCRIPWTQLPDEQGVNICMMVKEKNRVICDKCLSEIDQSLIIKTKDNG